MARNPRLENEAQNWIEEMTGIQFDSDFAESLKDGIILCKYALVTEL
jgi:hypothetical protein